MKVGCFSLLKPFTVMEEQLKYIQELGFKYADVTDTHPGSLLGREFGFSSTVSLDDNPMEVKRMFAKYGLTISTVCAHAALLDPSSPSRYGNTEITKAIKMAHAMGVRDVITTEGDAHTDWGHNLKYDQAITIIAEKLCEPVKLAEDLGVMLLLEPHGPYTCNIQAVKDIFSLLGEPAALGICMDTGNSWLGGADPVEYAKTFKSKIGHAHWKDIPTEMAGMRGKMFGCGMTLNALGTGVVDIKGVFEVLKDAPLLKHSTLEIADGNSLIESYEFLKKLGAE